MILGLNRLLGSENIIIEGKAVIQSGSILRGDLAQIKMGSYVIIRDEVMLRPTYTKTKQKGLKYVSLTMGDHVFVDRGSIVCALKIGNNVHIGKNCVIGHRAMLKDNCKILDNSVVPPDSIVPPFTVFGGRPASFVGELPESVALMHKEQTLSFYKLFQGVDPKRVQPQLNTHRAMAEQEKQS